MINRPAPCVPGREQPGAAGRHPPVQHLGQHPAGARDVGEVEVQVVHACTATRQQHRDTQVMVPCCVRRRVMCSRPWHSSCTSQLCEALHCMLELPCMRMLPLPQLPTHPLHQHTATYTQQHAPWAHLVCRSGTAPPSACQSGAASPHPQAQQHTAHHPHTPEDSNQVQQHTVSTHVASGASIATQFFTLTYLLTCPPTTQRAAMAR